VAFIRNCIVFKFIVAFWGQFATDREAEIHTESLSIMNTNSINVLWFFFSSDCNQIWIWSTLFTKNPQHKTEQKIPPGGSRNCSMRRMNNQAGEQQTWRSVWSLFPVVWHGHIEVDPTEIEWQHVDWILHVTLDTNKWPTTVNTIVNLRVS